MRANGNRFCNYLNALDYEFDCIGITENWLDSDNCSLFNLPGYNMISNCRPSRGEGGVSIILRQDISYKE